MNSRFFLWISAAWVFGMAGTHTAGAAAAGPNVKRVSSGICYARGQTGYDEARSFKRFDSIAACLEAGGRLPNTKGFFAGGEPGPAQPASAAVSAINETPGVGSRGDNKALFDTDTPGIIKKSRNGICHDDTSASYGETLHFTAYRTLQDCLQSGGRAVATRTTE